MPDEYVVAQHDFTPEHDDEIEFKVGDLILIVEKDDQYGDGWWQGRNPAGKTGLFPQSYTRPWDPSANAPADVHSPTALHTLAEEEENQGGTSTTSRSSSPVSGLPENTVMHATLTDVQQAIEQLAVRRETDTDAGRSFSFASTGGLDTETETEEEGEHEEGDAQEFRRTLAERAERVNARRAEQEPQTEPVAGTLGFLRRSNSNVVIPPPIDVELSDESDADDEDEEAVRRRHEDDVHPIHHRYTGSTATARLTDPDTVTTTDTTRQPSPSSTPAPPEVTIVPPPTLAAPQPQTPTTATAVVFPLPQSPPSQDEASRPSHAAELAAAISPPSPVPAPAPVASPTNVPLPMSPSPPPTAGSTLTFSNVSDANSSQAIVQGVLPAQLAEKHLRATQAQAPTPSPAPQPPVQAAAPPAQTPAPEIPTPIPAPPAPATDMRDTLKRTHPSEWTVDQVVEWLKSKGIDDATCTKFVEHEITGDVLLELDVSILKEEMGITALGKRMRIANAIVELKRPASFTSEQQAPSQMSHTGGFSQISQMNSMPNVVGGTNGHVGPTINGNGMEYPYNYSNPASPNMTLNGSRFDDGSISAFSGPTEDGLKVPRSRPAQLALSSPSEGALPRAQPTQILEEDDTQEITHAASTDDRGVQSETETPMSSSTFPSRRRRFLGLSTESGSSRGSRDRKSSEITSIPNSPALRDDKDSRKSPSLRPSVSMEDAAIGGKHQRGKKSVDERLDKPPSLRPNPKNGHGSERLSFFSATLGKGRKPAPRYSVYDDVSASATEKPPRSISRFITSGRKTSRPGTAPSGSAIPFGAKESGAKDDSHIGSVREQHSHALLRKRNISTTGTPPSVPLTPKPRDEAQQPMIAGPAQFEPGLSVLDQIGEPDHAGWLRKKGERYNTWKLRYLVLKGPHLYYLRSNAITETKIKGYIPVHGYKVIVDENLNPGKYGFRLVHETAPAHYFSSDEQFVVREWMKALIKATIDRDYSKPVVSSCNIPTIPLTVAQAMNPAPRPPSPTQRDATQKALRRENPNQLSSRDAKVLMGLPNGANAENSANDAAQAVYTTIPVEAGPTPPRPSRIARAPSVNNGSIKSGGTFTHTRGSASIDRMDPASEAEMIEWANSLLPEQYRIRNVSTDLSNGLVIFRLAESIKGRPSEPPIPDSVFKDPNSVDGMFKLFDYLLDNEVKVGGVSINDIKQGRVDKTLQLLRALRMWSEKRRSVAKSIGKGFGSAGPWVAVE